MEIKFILVYVERYKLTRLNSNNGQFSLLEMTYSFISDF